MTYASTPRLDGRCEGPFAADSGMARAAVDWRAGRLSASRMADVVAALAHAMAPRPGLTWESGLVVDKQGIGRLPGHRSTPIVVSIVAAAGVTMPHLGLPVPTGAAGTLDVMATMTRTDLDAEGVRQVVTSQGGCLASAVAAGMAPLDAPRPRPGESGAVPGAVHQVASALSRRLAAGVRHLLVDVAVGGHPGGVDAADFDGLRELLEVAGQALAIRVRVTRSTGSQPVGLGLGPALEARDMLAVLRGAAAAPVDLRMHALNEAGHLLELCAASRAGHGERDAWRLLDSGQAWARFRTICEAQAGAPEGGWREPPRARFVETVRSERAGHVKAVDAVGLGELARLAGAPRARAAGIVLRVRIGDPVQPGQPIFVIHAEDVQARDAVQAAVAQANPVRVEAAR